MTYRTAFIAGLSAGLLLVGLHTALAAAGAVISIDNFAFNTPTVTVVQGSSVNWTNADDIPHKVVSADGAFSSRLLDTSDSFSVTFAKPGTYEYFCSLHPKMTGKIIVTPAE